MQIPLIHFNIRHENYVLPFYFPVLWNTNIILDIVPNHINRLYSEGKAVEIKGF